jgi:hypothetical protein
MSFRKNPNHMPLLGESVIWTMIVLCVRHNSAMATPKTIYERLSALGLQHQGAQSEADRLAKLG